MGYAACKKMIDENLVPDGDRDRVIENLRSYEKVLGQMQQQQMDQNMNTQMADFAKKQKEKDDKRVEKKEKKNKVKKSTKSASIHTQYKPKKKVKK